MKRLGIFTVGGSPDPIINTLKTYDFVYVFFICSSGRAESSTEWIVDGEPLKEGVKIITKHVNLSRDKYEKILLDYKIVDDINSIYEELEKQLVPKVKAITKEERAYEVIANYTGGTKSMSIALALLAIYQDGWDLQLNTATRTNVIRIDRGDFPLPINKINLNYKMERHIFNELMRKFYYDEILERVEKFLTERTLIENYKNELRNIRQILRVLTLWDKFEHKMALEELESLSKGLPRESSMKDFLNKYLIRLKEILGQKKSHGYDRVIDLMHNAKRRVTQEKYDDAVARYYRAVEMMAQIRLNLEFGLNSSDIKCEKIVELPPKARDYLRNLCEKAMDEKGSIKIGLINDYELLAALDDKLGIFYLQRKKYLLNAIEKRNYSILAHGDKPILKEEFNEIEPIFVEFLSEGLKEVGVDINDDLQLPRSFSEVGLEIV